MTEAPPSANGPPGPTRIYSVGSGSRLPPGTGWRATATIVNVIVSESLYLTDDDYPGALVPRLVTVIHRVTAEKRDGVLVRVDPPIDFGHRQLTFAILIARYGAGTVDDIADGRLTTPQSVFVYGLNEPTQPQRHLYALADVWMAMWGLVDRVKRRPRPRRIRGEVRPR